MNYLAHIYLSWNSEELMIGNFIADAVKGKDFSAYKKGIANGITMHRAIDEYTDKHPVTALSRERIRPIARKYAGVVIDVFYDHFLAKNWDQFSAEPLETFAERNYKILNDHFSILPGEIQYMLPYMIKGNWLYNYSTIEGINKALSGLSRRTKFESGMEFAAAELEKNHEDYKNEFNLFFPRLIEFTKAFKP